MKSYHTHVGTKAILFTLILIYILLWPVCSFAGDYSGGGDGSAENPFKIATAADMNDIGNHPEDFNDCFILVNDINLADYTGTSFNIIGNYYDYGEPNEGFSGVFDGNGHIISNFSYVDSCEPGVGLFRSVKPGGLIKNVGMVNVNVEGQRIVGGLVAHNYDGTIKASYVKGAIVGNKYVGGLVGWSFGNVWYCYSQGSVTGTGTDYAPVGGLIGELDSNSCHSCYSTAAITGNSGDVGGLIGSNMGAVHLCYWDIDTSGQQYSSGGEGKNTLDMKTADTYDGWGYANVWKINEGNDYPRLYWEEGAGELMQDSPRSYDGGSGTEQDPYRIGTAKQLNTIGKYVADYNCHFKLTSDIDLSIYAGEEFNIIGFGIPFTGDFDGNYHVIKSFNWIVRPNYEVPWEGAGFIGLFGYIGNNGQVQNLGLEGVYINSGYSEYVGSLAGRNRGRINRCFASGQLHGWFNIGGMIGNNLGTIENSYSIADVNGVTAVGGLVGDNGSFWYGENRIIVDSNIINCYSAGTVAKSWDYRVGGFIGRNYSDITESCFWDKEKSGQEFGIGYDDASTTEVYGYTTTKMQAESTFTSAGWDFVGEIINGIEDIWTICEGLDYPRLRWQYKAPVLYEEPETTVGYTNVISWEAPADANADVYYYAECAVDANFTVIVADSGWVTDTNCEFVGLNTGQRYWYRVKTGRCDYETEWSAPESSLQVSLGDAVDVMLEPDSMKNSNMKNALIAKIDAVLSMIEAGKYNSALAKLENDILQKTDGCADSGEPDENDWIITCEQQQEIYPLIIETIDYVLSLI